MTFTAADDLTRLDAGQKLDIEVARIVLGALFCNRDLNAARGRSCSRYNEPEHYTRDGFHTRTHQPLPGYSTDMSAAWQLVEHLVKQGARVDLQNRATGWALHVISHGGTGREFVHWGRGETPQLAICRAALEVAAHESPEPEAVSL